MEKIIKEAIRYMEDHVCDPIAPNDVAKHVHVSSFHLHRIFKIVTEITIGEYLRNRRLSLAGLEVLGTDKTILEIALKYQYESQEGFQKAFYRFHGINPQKARQTNASLKTYHPLNIHITFKGGRSMDYKIVTKDPFTLLCVKRAFPNSIIEEEDNTDIPDFWTEKLEDGTVKKLVNLSNSNEVYGPCGSVSKDSDTFFYGIGVPYDGEPIQGFDLWYITHSMYAVFEANSKDDMGPVWKSIMEEFFPNSDYDMADQTDFEVYSDEKESFCEIWVPIELSVK